MPVAESAHGAADVDPTDAERRCCHLFGRQCRKERQPKVTRDYAAEGPAGATVTGVPNSTAVPLAWS
jgi:hypothetical protein